MDGRSERIWRGKLSANLWELPACLPSSLLIFLSWKEKKERQKRKRDKKIWATPVRRALCARRESGYSSHYTPMPCRTHKFPHYTVAARISPYYHPPPSRVSCVWGSFSRQRVSQNRGDRAWSGQGLRVGHVLCLCIYCKGNSGNEMSLLECRSPVPEFH